MTNDIIIMVRIRTLLAVVAVLTAFVPAKAVADFEKVFADSTLRIDYILAGDAANTAVYLKECCVSDGWAGRRHNLDEPLLRGNGSVTVRDAADGTVLYVNTFSTLFQEWQHTDEAKAVAKAFEDTRLVPMPRKPVDITLTLLDNTGRQTASLTHRVDPADILIRHTPSSQAETRYMHRAGSPDRCVDIAVVAEGYTEAEKEKFFDDALRAAKALLSHEPFSSMQDKINILAVATLAGDSGPDEPGKGVWKRTAHRSHYDTFYSDRYLTTPAIHEINESLSGLPYEHIILMVNTPRYGGGGIFNQITVCSSDHPTFKEVLVHEFGHAFGGLADEYFYNDDSDTTYASDAEPWEPNISTLIDFESKWADMLPAGTPVPTPAPKVRESADQRKPDKSNPAELQRLTQTLGVFEGAGYRLHGIYRPAMKCRMKENAVEHFCPVCSRAIERAVEWSTQAE